MTDTRADTIRRALTKFVPVGFRDEYGVWHTGPHRRDALAALDDLLADLAQATKDRDGEQAVKRHWRKSYVEVEARVAALETALRKIGYGTPDEREHGSIARAALASSAPAEDTT